MSRMSKSTRMFCLLVFFPFWLVFFMVQWLAHFSTFCAIQKDPTARAAMRGTTGVQLMWLGTVLLVVILFVLAAWGHSLP